MNEDKGFGKETKTILALVFVALGGAAVILIAGSLF